MKKGQRFRVIGNGRHARRLFDDDDIAELERRIERLERYTRFRFVILQALIGAGACLIALVAAHLIGVPPWPTN